MPAPIKVRVLSDRSVRELVDYRNSVGHELSVHIYYLPGNRFIVAPISGVAPQVETREVTVLPDTCSDDDLGRAVCDNLLWHEKAAPSNLRDHTSSDWPAYVASGLKTVRRFQADSILITISTMNSALQIEARPYNVFNSGDRFVGSGATIHNDHETLGSKIRGAIRGVAILQEADYY